MPSTSTLESRPSGRWAAIARSASTPTSWFVPITITIDGSATAAAPSPSCKLIASQKRRIVSSGPMARPQPNGIFLAEPESPAEGRRLAVKDLFDTAGLTTTYGSSIYAEHVPQRSAEAVTRLETAGYANVGKTNLHEFAYGITSVNPHYGTVPNPTYPGRMAGGSSGRPAAAGAAAPAEAAGGTGWGGSGAVDAACACGDG